VRSEGERKADGGLPIARGVGSHCMPKPLVFMMGRSPVFVPVDRHYARNHMWAMRCETGYRLGFTAYAVRLLGEIRCLRWSAVQDAAVKEGQAVGYVEASKATSDVYSPVSGSVAGINSRVLTEPTVINASPYDEGWLLNVSGPIVALFAPDEYVAYLAST